DRGSLRTVFNSGRLSDAHIPRPRMYGIGVYAPGKKTPKERANLILASFSLGYASHGLLMPGWAGAPMPVRSAAEVPLKANQTQRSSHRAGPNNLPEGPPDNPNRPIPQRFFPTGPLSGRYRFSPSNHSLRVAIALIWKNCAAHSSSLTEGRHYTRANCSVPTQMVPAIFEANVPVPKHF